MSKAEGEQYEFRAYITLRQLRVNSAQLNMSDLKIVAQTT